MTSLALNSAPSRPAPAKRGSQFHLTLALAAWQCAAGLMLVSLTIPDAVLHAKVYKMGLIVKNMQHRYFDQASS